MTTFSRKEDNYIRKYYLDMPVKTMAAHLGRSYTGVMGRLNAMGLHIPQELREARKRSGMFSKGHAPFNKGKKMPKSIYKKVEATMFKPGHLPVNTKYDGAISIRCDKNGTPYYHIRVSKAKWEYLHRYNYHKHFGEIPRTHIVAFKDGNTLNPEPSNLILMSKADNMRRNTIHNYPEEIKTTVNLLKSLNKKIKNAEK